MTRLFQAFNGHVAKCQLSPNTSQASIAGRCLTKCHMQYPPKTSVWQCDTVTMWHPSKASVWHPPCKYSVQRFDHSHATRLQQFNTNYFHLTGAAIKTVSPSDWDSCLCAARVLWRNVDCAQLPPLCSSPLFVLCASLYLHFASLPPSCRQQLDAPITPKCSLANFPPDRQNNVVIRRVCRANWDLLRWDGCN